MFAWVHQRIHEDEGISLVEMLVSILLMGLVLAALGSTLTASMAAARQNEGLTQATAIANEELEKLQAASWTTLDPAASPLPGTTPIPRDGRSYEVVREVSWIQAPHYKRYAVTLTWNENGDDHNLTVEGRRARRAGESNTPVAPINPFRVLSFTVNPDPVYLDASSRTLAADPTDPTAMFIDVELNEPARDGSVWLTWPQPSPTRTLELEMPVDDTSGRKWTGSLPSGETYPSGWLTFRVTAAKDGTTTTCTASPLPASPDCAESTTAAYLLAPFQNGPLYYDNQDMRLYSGTPGPTGTGDRVCVGGNQRLRNTNPFYAGLRGLGIDDTVSLVRTDVAGVSFPMTYYDAGANGRWWVASVTSSGAGTFTVGTTSTWEMRWRRSYDNATGTVPLRFYVQNANGQSAC